MVKQTLFKLVAVGVLVFSLGVGWFWLDLKSFMDAPLAVPADGVQIEVKSGDNLTRISRRLQQQGLIDQARYLVWFAKFQGVANDVKTGEYAIEQGMNARQLLDKIVSGQTIQYSTTIIEGWNSWELFAALKQDPNLVHTSDGLSDEQIMAKIGHPGEHPEGRFLPDTYSYPKGTTDIEFLKRAYDAMEAALEQQWQQRAPDLPYKSPYEALIMASIVEKETGVAHERAEIAGVFVRRLKKGMRLQTDPTVIYGIGKNFDGNIRRKDLVTDTPYNTYRRGGLTPTPIAMPGLAALEAAMHPKDGDSLYFVATGKNGEHKFSATLREHNNAVIKYQLKGKRKPFSSMPK